tara:strand:- start:66 stop:329 length:264 start_codon:yes stop_codon:yes gene_type:complete
MTTPHEQYYDEDRYRQRDEDIMHPTCEECGKYIFAVDGCKGHGDDEEEVVPGAWLKKEIARKTAELEAKGDPLAVFHGIVRSIFGGK